MPDDAASQPAVEAALLRALQGMRATRWVVGFSGGIDSTALLVAASQVLQRVPQLARRIHAAHHGAGASVVPRLVALHVHHGLHAEADRWAALARANALRFGAGFAQLHVTVDGAGEAAARAARYAAFSRFLAPGDLLLLAHQRDDDAETVLMDVLRGSGVRTMPAARVLGAGRLVRPLLELSRRDLLEYMAGRGVPVVDDPTNRDPRVSRALLRQSVLPVVEAVWPGVASRLQQLARAQSGRDLALQLLLAPVLEAALDPHGGLRLSVLRAQPLPVAQVLLEAWLQPQVGRLSGRHLHELLRQLLTSEVPARLRAQVHGRPVRQTRDVVYLLAAPARDAAVYARSRRAPAGQGVQIADWNGVLPLDTPVGVLQRLPFASGSTPGMRWPAAAVTVCVRRGGERLRLHDAGPSRTVKSLLREAGVPVWLRERWPLLYLGDELIAVAGVAVSAAWLSGPGETGYVLRLQPA